MTPIKLTYGVEGFKEIKKFLNDNYNEEYTLSIYDIAASSTAEIMCDFNEMLDVIMLVSNVEHDFQAWIGVNELSDSYVVGLRFTRRNIETPAVYRFKDNTLKKISR